MRRIYFGLCVIVLWIQCKSDNTRELTILKGEALGTYFAITYVADQDPVSLQKDLGKIFDEVNISLSTYIDSSFISLFNSSQSGMKISYQDSLLPEYAHFLSNLRSAQQLSKATLGYFDPTLMPLISYWGFGSDKFYLKEIDTLMIQSLLALKGMDLIRILYGQDSIEIHKKPGQQLDFNASAKGYVVDEIGRFLESKHIYDYLVDIGGEQRIRGVKAPGDPWRIAINVPDISASVYDTMRSFEPGNYSLATSGNYRNYYEIDGVKWGHTIDPYSGYAVKLKSPLLSATILHSECMVADAWATACMAMGFEKARKILMENELDACLIYLNEESGELDLYFTGKMESLL